MLLLTLDDKINKPIYQQLIEQIRSKIENRLLCPGEKLPSTRKLADQLGIHRSTVATAYQELWSLGFVDLSPGALPRVRERTQIATADSGLEEGLIDWGRIASPAADANWRTYQLNYGGNQPTGNPVISFRTLSIDRRLFPLDSFRMCVDRAIKDQGEVLLGYGTRAGYPPLREYIARRLQSHGITITPQEILITNGSQQGIDLVFRMIAAPGKAVAIEAPTYDYVPPLLRFYGITPLEIPVREDGMDLSVLEEKLQRERPALVYTMPTFQNPTGISTSQAHRERLLALCETYGVPILEDGFEEEMKYCGRVVLPIKSMDKHRLVIYCGTFSKVLFPGVRIGWLAADTECLDRLIAIQSFSELSPSMVLQAAIHGFCQRGFYDRHVSKMHRVYRRRMEIAVRALRQHLSLAWAEWTVPSGGFIIWLKIKTPINPPDNWRAFFANAGIEVAIGNNFFFSGVSDIYLRLSISALNEEEIEEGIRRLGAALRQLYK